MATVIARLQPSTTEPSGVTDCEEREHELLMLDRKLSFNGDGDFRERVNQVSSPSTSFVQSGLGRDDFTPMGSSSMLGEGWMRAVFFLSHCLIRF